MSTEKPPTANALRLREWRREAGLVEDRKCGVCGAGIVGKNKWACNDCKDKWPCVVCKWVGRHYSKGMCHRCYQSSQYLKNSKQAQWRMKRYGLTEEAYNAMLEAQGGGCAGCLRRPGAVTLHIDHDHACCPGHITCGKCVRGLLCYQCNTTLGNVKDDPAVLDRLAAYLRSAL